MAVGNELGIRIVILGLGEFRRASRDVRSELDATQSKIQKLSGRVNVLGSSLQKFGSALSSMGRAMTFSFTLPLITAMGGLIGSGIRFEDAFAGVGKTVDGVAYGFRDVVARSQGFQQFLQEQGKLFELSGQSVASYQQLLDQYIATLDKEARAEIFQSGLFGQLTEDGKRMREEFRKMALEIPIGVDELARVGQVAGQLGVPAGQIVEFTKVAALMGVTTDLSAEEAAFAFARIGNIMGVSADDLAEYAAGMGNAIVALGNNAAATEPEIVNMALRIAAAGRIVGLTEPQILGISTTLSEMGIRAEMGGTAVSRVLQEMFFAMAEGGETAEEFANIAGMSVDEFAATLKGNPVQALSIFLEQLADLQDAGQLTEDQLLAMGLSGIRVRQVLNSLGPNVGGMTENIELATRAWEEQIALQEEAAKRFATVKSQIQLLKNAFVDLGITLFDLFKDDISNFVNGIRDLVTQFKELSPETQKTIVKFALIAAAIGPTLVVLGTLIQSVGTVVTAFGGLGVALSKAATGLVTLIPSLLSIVPALLPIIAVVGGVYLAFKTNFLGIADLVQHVVNVFKFAGIPNLIRQIIDQLTSGDLAGAWETFKTTTEIAINAIKNYIIPAIKDWFTNAKATIQEKAPEVKTEIVNKVTEWADEFINWIPQAVTDLGTELDKIKDEIVAWIEKQDFSEKISGWTDDFTKWAKDNVAGPIADELDKINWEEELASASDTLQKILDTLGSATVDFLSWINRNVVYPIVEKLITINWSEKLSSAEDTLQKILDAIASGTVDFVGWVNRNIVYPISEKITFTNWLTLLAVTSNVLQKITDGIAGGVVDFFQWALENVAQPIANKLSDPELWTQVAELLYEGGKLVIAGLAFVSILTIKWAADNIAIPIAKALNTAVNDPAQSSLYVQAGMDIAKSIGQGMRNASWGLAVGFATQLGMDIISAIHGGNGGGESAPGAQPTPVPGAGGSGGSSGGGNIIDQLLDIVPFLYQHGGKYDNHPFWAGERGPELIFPKTSGFVASNHLLRNLANTMMNPVMAGGYNRSTNVYNPVFNAAPTREIIRANSDIYSEWIISGMANR